MVNQRESFFSIDHIRASTFHASLTLTEEALYCLELVCELVETGLQFQFKGGNSLLLILDEPQRFSIDVDIATDRPASEIEAALSKLVEQRGVFTRWEKRQHTTKPWIPLSSYYLYYRSKVTDAPDTSIMLDAQMHKSPYPCESRPVVCGKLFRSDVRAVVPLPGSIIGDKLLTLGPRTLGIPVGKGKSAQRLKHVFDVSRLLGMHPPLLAIRQSFNSCLAFENDLQKLALASGEIVRDTLEAYWPVMTDPIRPASAAEGSILSEHCSGLEPFAAHLFRESYSWSDLRCDMARAACCIAGVGTTRVTDKEFAAVFTHGGTAAESQIDLCSKAIISWVGKDVLAQWGLAS